MMLRSNLENKPTSTRSINISVIKPNGISSFWNWFTNKSQKSNLQNIMCDKTFRLKLNAEELDALKRNGIDLQKLQDTVAGNENKMRKNIFILSKDQTELKKNDLLNNSVLCDIMKNKDVSKKAKKYKKSLVSLSTISIKSKNNAMNSNVTYVHSIKSKRSIVNSVSSRVSLKVGLKSSKMVDIPINAMNKNILMKAIPEALLKGNMQKKVFVPIYLGKKKSSKTSKSEKKKIIENKSKHCLESESNVIPLLLTKFKTMEGQISDIENTTKKISEAVLQRNMYKTNSPSNEKKNNLNQPNDNRAATHKMYKKISLKKLKQNKIDSKIPNNKKSSKDSSYNTEFSFNSVGGIKNTILTNNNKGNIENIKDILENPKTLLKHPNFIIPSNLSENALFTANPDAGCDIILKLFEALSETNDSHKETTKDNIKINETPKDFAGDIINTPKQNRCGNKSELGCDENPKSLSSISASQIGLINNKTDRQSNNYSQQKKNISCPSSNTVLSYNDNSEELKLTSKNSLGFESKKENDEIHKIPENETNHIIHSIKQMQEDKRDEPGVNLEKLDPITGRENYKKVNNEEKNRKNCQSSLNQSIAIFEEIINKNKTGLVKINPAYKKVISNSKTNNDVTNLKVEEINYLKGTCLEPEYVIENQTIKLPIATDSRNICSISIEQAERSDTTQQSEVNIKGTKGLHPITKNEPKFSITILVKNNLNDGILDKSYIPNNSNKTDKKAFYVVKDDELSAMAKSHTILDNQEEFPAGCKIAEENVNYNSAKYVPPLKFETFDTSPISLPACSFVGKSNNDNEICLSKLKLKYNVDEFGIEGAAYLNQEQRIKLDKQTSTSNVVNTKKLQPPPKINVNLGAKSSTGLNNDCIHFRHLSESSLNPQKTTAITLQKQSTQSSQNETSFKAIKNCSRTPSYFECVQHRKELGVTNKLEVMHTDKNIPCKQSSSCVDKQAIVRSKEELCVISETRKTLNSGLNNVGCFDAISNTLPVVNCKKKVGNEQDYFVVNNKNYNMDESKNSEVSNSYCIKKRSHFTTLNVDSTVKDFEGDVLSDKMSIGDHQTNTNGLNSLKEINNPTFIKNLERSSVFVNLLNYQTINSNFYTNPNEEITHQPNVMITSQLNESVTQDCALASSPIPETMCFIAKETITNNSKLNENVINMSKDIVTSQSKISVTEDCGFVLLPVSEMSKGSPNILPQLNSTNHGVITKSLCILAKEAVINNSKSDENLIDLTDDPVSSQPTSSITTDLGLVPLFVSEMPKCSQSVISALNVANEGKLNAGILDQSNSLVNSKKKGSVIPECVLTSLSVAEMPECCKCILDKSNTATGTIVQSQAEIVLEKEGPFLDKIRKISVICNTCMSKPENFDTNFDKKIMDTAQETYDRHELQDDYALEQNITEIQALDTLLQPDIIRNKIIEGVSKDGRITNGLSELMNNENKLCPFLGNVLDMKHKNEIKHCAENEMSCYHSCLALPSEDNIYSDTPDNKSQNIFGVNDTSGLDISNECNIIASEIARYYLNTQEMYSYDNLLHSKIELNFNRNERHPFCRPTSENDDNRRKHEDNSEFRNILTLMNTNCKLEDTNEKDKDPSQTFTGREVQMNGTQTVLEREEKEFHNVQPVETSKNIYSSSINYKGLKYLTAKNKARSVKQVKIIKKHTLKTIKEIDSGKNSHENSNSSFYSLPSQEIGFSSNYVVNCVNSMEYDFMSKTGESLIACSLNSYSSTNNDLLRDL